MREAREERTGSAKMESCTDCNHSVRWMVLKSFSRKTPASATRTRARANKRAGKRMHDDAQNFWVLVLSKAFGYGV